MAANSKFTAFTFDDKAVRDAWTTWANYGVRAAQLQLEAADALADAATSSSKETISNLRELAVVRDDASAYAEAAQTFARQQGDLVQRTFEAFGGIAKKAAADAQDIATDAGETVQANINDVVAANANAADSAVKETKKAAAKAA